MRNSKIKNQLFSQLEKRIFYKSLMLFDEKVRKKLFAIALIQIILGGLDLIGVSLIGLIGALSVTGVKSGLPGGRLESVLNFMGLSGMTFQQQVAILGILAVLFLVGKTVISAIFTRKILYFLGLQGAAISNEILTLSMSKSYLFIRTRNIQELIYQSSNGATASNSERSISSSIAKLSQEISVMVIAHRLSSIRGFQRIVYMDKGKILASGTFAEVCAQVPDFELNTKAMGLK